MGHIHRGYWHKKGPEAEYGVWWGFDRSRSWIGLARWECVCVCIWLSLEAVAVAGESGWVGVSLLVERESKSKREREKGGGKAEERCVSEQQAGKKRLSVSRDARRVCRSR